MIFGLANCGHARATGAVFCPLRCIRCSFLRPHANPHCGALIFAELTELYELLRDNYVEDDDAMFRFAYAKEFLRWALTPPGYKPDWIVGVRSAKGGRLFASITGIPAEISSYGRHVPMCEINFLCVHKKLRSKRLAPVLIKEVTRRVNLTGVWQATYTAGVVLPKPVARCQYWHRSIQPKKLIEVGFSRLAPRMTLARTIRLYQLPDVPEIAGIRPATAADVPAITRLINAYLPAFSLHPVLSEEEVAHWLLPHEGVIDSFVVDVNHAAAAPGSGGAAGGAGDAAADDALLAELEGSPAASAGGKKGKGGKGKAAAGSAATAAAGGAAAAAPAAAAPYVHPISGSGVTDFISFYHLPSSIIGHDKHKVLRAVYSYYMVPGGSPHLRAATEAAEGGADAAAAVAKKADSARKHGHTLEEIMNAALVLAKQVRLAFSTHEDRAQQRSLNNGSFTAACAFPPYVSAAARNRCIQCVRPDGKRPSRAQRAEVRPRRWPPAVLSVQLGLPRNGTQGQRLGTIVTR